MNGLTIALHYGSRQGRCYALAPMQRGTGVTVAAVLLSLAACAHAPPPPARPAVAGEERVAAALLEDLARRDWAAAVARFDGRMAQVLPAARLQAVWTEMLAVQGE